MYVIVVVCLLATLLKNFERICTKFSGKVGNGPVNIRLNFGGDPDNHLDTGIVFLIRHYWEIRKMVNGHKSAAHTDSPDGGTGKMRLGEGMRCPSASSLIS